MAKRTIKDIENVKVKDATRDLVLHIKPGDIKGAKREDNYACAAANALCRQEHFRQAKVCKTTTFVQMKDGTWRRYRTPKSLYIELIVLDRKGEMAPGDHVLAAPKGSHRLGMHEKPRGKGGTTGRLPKPQYTIEHVRPNSPRGRGALTALLNAPAR
jgi:hypothetical protein